MENPRGIQLSLAGMLLNAALAVIKLAAGIVGTSYALVADAIESFADVFGSAVVWRGLRIAAKPADEDHPYGHGKAEALAAVIVSVMLFGAAVGIAVEAVREILTPHHAPAPFTLVVLVGVVAIKEGMFRIGRRIARDTTSGAVLVDAWHHRSDAITSAAAFIGITIALIGGAGFESADDWAALFAAGVIAINAWGLIAPQIHELMDRVPMEIVARARLVAAAVPGVEGVEKTLARKTGVRYWIDMHIEVDPELSVREAHELAHRVKDAIRGDMPAVMEVLIHVEPSGRG